MSKTINTTSNTNGTIGNINIVPEQKKNLVTLANKCGTEFMCINGKEATIAKFLNEKDKELAMKCMQFMVDNCEYNEDPKMVIYQCSMLVKFMADLEKCSLEDIIKFNGVDFAIEPKLKKVYAEDGSVIIDMIEKYPKLAEVEMSDEAVSAILKGELNSIPNAEIEAIKACFHLEEKIEREEDGTIDITKDQKLGTFDTIKGLRSLGMVSTWYNVHGCRQLNPLCYYSEASLNDFKQIVAECLNNDKNYFEVMMASCRYKQNDINPDEEVYTVKDVDCMIDYNSKICWTIDGNTQITDLSDIEYNLPKEAMKVMLLERAKTYIEEQMIDDEEYDDEDYR